MTRAVLFLKDERERKGLTVPYWMNYVKADILRHDTPIEARQLVAGALNASARVQKSSSVSDVLRLIRRDDPHMAKDMSERIVQAVEACGLNSPNSSPVCSVL